MTNRPRAALILVLLAGIALTGTGCRKVEQLAWAAEARALGPAPGPHEGISHWLAGLIAESQGQLDEAKSRYAKAHRLDPGSVQILLHLGTVQLHLDELEAATRSFEKAAEIAGADPRPRFLLGVLYTHQERFEEASRQYAEVLKQDPRNLGALSYLADLYILQDKLEEGWTIYERLLQEKPDSAVAHFNVGVLYARAQQWERSVHHMAKAVEIDPAYLEARLGLGVSLELAGQVIQAKEQFLKALQLEPMNTQLIHYLAQVCYRLGDLEEAAGWLSRYLSFQPRDWQVHLELGHLRVEQGRWEEAVVMIQTAFGLYPEPEPPVPLWTALGLAYERGAQFETAQRAYEEARTADPLDPKPYLYLGALHHRLGQYEKAERILSEGHRIHPDDPDLLNSLGFLYADWGRELERALSLIEKALGADPENGAYLDSLGWATYRLGRLQESVSLLEEAARRTPDAEILEHLGQVYLSLGRRAEAEASWRRALSLGLDRPELIQRLQSHIQQLKRKDR